MNMVRNNANEIKIILGGVELVDKALRVMENTIIDTNSEEIENAEKKGTLCGNRGEDTYDAVSYSLSENVSGNGLGDGSSLEK